MYRNVKGSPRLQNTFTHLGMWNHGVFNNFGTRLKDQNSSTLALFKLLEKPLKTTINWWGPIEGTIICNGNYDCESNCQNHFLPLFAQFQKSSRVKTNVLLTC
jgi:hypothetical protein